MQLKLSKTEHELELTDQQAKSPFLKTQNHKTFRENANEVVGMSYRRHNYDVSAGWSSLVARRAHNPKVAGSNPAPATQILK